MLRRLVVHVGTHKTGSTAIQIELGRRRAELATLGVCVPQAGARVNPDGNANHHLLARELLERATGHTATVLLDALLAELRASDAPRAILSSESLCCLYRYPAVLSAFAGALAQIGYATTVVVYVREQAAFLESLYAELIRKGARRSFEALLAGVLERTIVETGTAYSIDLDYRALVRPFTDAFGEDHVVVRAYRADLDSAALLEEFFSMVDIAQPPRPQRVATRANVRLSFEAVLALLHERALERDPSAASVRAIVREIGCDDARLFDGPFLALDAAGIDAVRARFAPSNRALETRFGIALHDEFAARANDRAGVARRVLREATLRWQLDETMPSMIPRGL